MRSGILVGLVACCVAGSGARAYGEDPSAGPAAMLVDAGATSTHRYDAKDDQGVGLDCLDVVALPGGGYAGVHHALIAGHFQTRLVTSPDLLHWRFRTVVGDDSDMPTLVRLPDGAFVEAEEHASTLGLLPLNELPAGLAGPTGLWMLNKSQLRFRFYESLADLVNGRSSRTFTAPLTLSPTNEGTPDVSVQSGSRPDDLRLVVTFHYFSDLSGDGVPDADRQAVGTLVGFRHWRAWRTPEVDDVFLDAPRWHAGFDRPPHGNIGDRDAFIFGGRSFVIHETQYTPGAFGTFRLWLRDPSTNVATPLNVATEGGSRAFGNPVAEVLPGPSGRPVLFFSAYAFGDGAAPGEAGELISLHPLGG